MKKKLPPDSLCEAFALIFDSVARPGIFLTVQPESDSLPVGASKMGGCPDLPPGTAWPTFDAAAERRFPHAFFAQLNLADFVAADVAHELPPDGLLSFFAEMDAGDGWDGSDPADRGRWCVLYTPAGSELERRQLPDKLDAFWHLSERAVVPSARPVPPDLAHIEQDPAMARLFIDACDGDEDMAFDSCTACRAAYLGRAEKDASQPLLLGYPDIAQYPMERLCEEASRKHALGVSVRHQFSDAERADIELARQDWVLLFQYCNVCDADSGDFIFGDFPGNLCFWIRKQDLAARDFSKVWAAVQCD